MAVTTISTVIARAVPEPHACSSTVDATEVALFNSSSGTAPSTPICSRKYRVMMPRIEKMIERGMVRPVCPEIQTSPTEVLTVSRESHRWRSRHEPVYRPR
jgi:hypothetical protein